MRKLSEFYGEDAIDVLGDLIDPVVNIMQDEHVQEVMNNDDAKIAQVASYIIKNYKHDIFSILRLLSDDEEYHPNFFEMLKDVISLFEDAELMDFFDLQAQTDGVGAFGLATGNTGETDAE